jgi:hypothetical protein
LLTLRHTNPECTICVTPSLSTKSLDGMNND